MRILGIDYGDSRIGIAVSDPFGWTAQAVETVKWKDDINKPVNRICEIIKKFETRKIVVGFPKNMNGTIGIRGEKTEEFISILKEKFNNNNIDQKTSKTDNTLEIVKWDERLTTVAATRTMHELGIKTSKKKGVVDQIAAVYILQGYLDSIKK